MSSVLGSTESQERLRLLFGRRPSPERDLRDYLAGEFQEGLPMRVTTIQPDRVGRQLADREVSRLEVLHAIRLLPYRQRRIVQLLYLEREGMEDVGQRLHISQRTLARERNAALRAMVLVIYEWW